MKKKIKNVLAALGAFVVFIFVTSIAITLISGGSFTDKVGVVEISGLITDPDEINEKIIEYGERDDVKAVILRINSPGGSVGPSQEIYREVLKLKAIKPVIASMGAVAASGGYYIAAAADKIVANPGTITGSIGVIIEFIDGESLLRKIGLRGEVVKSGDFKDTGSPFRKMGAQERELLQGLIDDVHRQFVEAVAKGRDMDFDKVKVLADGRIFSGEQAKNVGLVDSLGNMADAIDLVAELAGIEGDPAVIYPSKNPGLLGSLIGDNVTKVFSDLIPDTGLMYLLPGSIR
ncbi:MAG: signal peptide peptidase SppA [Deltaproteobacteria bacterium]|nr:signal peptide peptidase SppA [Deltaproteobacteria bacterium]